jgi:hypothetical protein
MPLPRQAFNRLKPGLQRIAYPDYSFQGSTAGPGVPGRMPLPRQVFNRLKPGLQRIAYPGYLHKLHQPGIPFKTAVGAAAVTQKLGNFPIDLLLCREYHNSRATAALHCEASTVSIRNRTVS